MSRTRQKYLAQYSEPECKQLQSFPVHAFAHGLVIPCYDEDPAFVSAIESSFEKIQNVLVVLVINQPDDLEQTTHLNLQLVTFFNDHFNIKWSHQQLTLFQSPSSSLYWLVVNKYEPSFRIPPKQGVGLARKIGCDLAVELYDRQYLNSAWLQSCDADTRLPSNYFQLPEASAYSAATYNFTHVESGPKLDSGVLQATQLYEQALHYYVKGLTWAGSPYNTHSIGSCLAVNVDAYCQVRGFPKRSAGEDFYLLNKLRKVAPILKASEITLMIAARLSHRVPFGTGPAVQKILELSKPSEEYSYYSPHTFIALKQWLETIPHIWPNLAKGLAPLAGLPEGSLTALEHAHIHRVLTHIKRQAKTQEACEKAIHEWFDAFQTLKFIRRLQESQYPALPLKQCLQEAPFC